MSGMSLLHCWFQYHWFVFKCFYIPVDGVNEFTPRVLREKESFDKMKWTKRSTFRSQLNMHEWVNKYTHIRILQGAADVIISTLNLRLVSLFDALQSLSAWIKSESLFSPENMCLKTGGFLLKECDAGGFNMPHAHKEIPPSCLCKHMYSNIQSTFPELYMLHIDVLRCSCSSSGSKHLPCVSR